MTDERRPAASGTRFAQASLVLAGLMFVVPFLQPYHRFPVTGFYTEWLAFALGLAAASLLLKKQLWREMALPAVALAPLALIALLGLQIVLERVPYPEQALTAALYAAWATLLILLGAVLRRGFAMAAIAATLAWSLLAGGLLNALAALLQHYQLQTPFGFLITPKMSSAVYGNLAQPNHFADYVTLALASAAYLYGRGSLRREWAAPCAAALLLVLALSGSRSPWLYLGALALLSLLLHQRLDNAESRRLCLFTLCLLPGFVAAQWIVTLPFMIPKEGLLVTSAQRLFEVASGIEPRLQLAREAWQMFLDAPVLGAGWGQFAWHHFLYQALTGADAAPGLFNHAHNIVLHLLAETGMVGALLMVGAALMWLMGLRGVRFDIEWWWLLTLLAVIGIHSMLELPLWYSNFLGIAAFLLGAGAKDFVVLRAGQVARVAVAAALTVGWVNAVMVLPAYRDFERLMFDPHNRAAIAADDGAFAREIMQLHRDPFLKPYVEVAVSFGIAVNQEQLSDKLELNTRTVRFAPGDLAVYRQALLLALAGERAAALRQLERAARVYPAELDDVVAQLRELERRHSDEFAPLLELAATRFAEFQARGAAP